MNKKVQSIVDKIKKVRFSRGDVHSYFEKMQGNGKTLGITVVAAFLVMIFVCAVVFFLNVKGPEQVMVPQVCGKKLANAIIEMGEKELYPTLATRDVTDPALDGIILEQSPKYGSIVNGYSRVSLVVGRISGPDQIDDYVGKNIDDVRNEFYARFAKHAIAPITVGQPTYKVSDKAFGTILEQYPKPGTLISESVELNLIVSKGPEGDSVHPVNFVGKSVDYMLGMMDKCLVVYDFTGQLNRDFWCLFLEYVKNEAKAGRCLAKSGEVLRNYQVSAESVPAGGVSLRFSDRLMMDCLQKNSKTLVFLWMKLYALLRKG